MSVAATGSPGLTRKRVAIAPLQIVLALLIVSVLIIQSRLLFVFPQPDGARWWGDETGQMVELKTELTGGFARIPNGLGASVSVTNGIVRGNSWLAAAIYGVPVLVFLRFADIVSIGRIVTLLLSIVLCIAMFRMLCAFDVSPPFSLLAVLLLVSTRSFFFASHAARLDVASGLSVLAFTWYLSDRYERLIQSRWHPTRRWLFIYGAIAMLFATLSIHLLTLLGLLSIYMLWRFGSLRRPSYLLFAMAGVVVMAGVLVAVYAMSGAPWTLFGASAKPNQFQSVAGMLPIERPFSRSVQVANILERFSGLWSEAPAFLILILIWVGTLLFKRQAASCQPRRSFLLGASGTVLVAWLLFESPALYYYVHILPLFIVAMIADIYARLQVGKMLTSRIALLAVPLAYFGISDASRAAHVSQRIAHDNRAALEQVVRYVTSESHEGSHSVILAQNPAIAYLEADRNVRLMTAHIVSFPLTDQPIATALRNLGVRYILLYAAHDGSIYSEDYRMLRPVADSIGTIVFKQTGVLFDVHRDYFASSKVALASDTLLLYKLSDTLVR